MLQSIQYIVVQQNLDIFVVHLAMNRPDITAHFFEHFTNGDPVSGIQILLQLRLLYK